MTAEGRTINTVEMHRIFNNPAVLYGNDAVHEATYGLVAQNCEKFDPIFVRDVCRKKGCLKNSKLCISAG